MLFRFDEFDRTFDLLNGWHQRLDRALGHAGLNDVPRAGTLGAFDWADTPEHYAVTADLPGVAAEDLEITLEEKVLTVAARRTVDVPEGYRAHRRERRPFEFRRSFALPGQVDPERVDATLDAGVLTLKLAKVAPAGPRQITVNAA